MKTFKPLVFGAGAVLVLSSCGNPFGASTDSGDNAQSAQSSSSSTSTSADPSGSPSSSSASVSAAPSSSVVTVTASPQPEASTVTVTAPPQGDSGSSSSGRSALEANASKLRGDHAWSISAADTSTFRADAELSWITVTAPDGAAHIMLFHYGDYLGTATLNPIQGSPAVSRSNGQHEISASVGSSHATFTWNSGQNKIVMNGDLPTY